MFTFVFLYHRNIFIKILFLAFSLEILKFFCKHSLSGNHNAFKILIKYLLAIKFIGTRRYN